MKQADDTPPTEDQTPASDTPAFAIPWGIVWHVLGMMLFVCMDAVSKHLVQSLPVAQILWVRYVFFAAFGLALALHLGGFAALRAKAPMLQITRALALVIEIGLFTLSFRYIALADTHAIAAMTPLFVTALAVPFLGEKVGIRRWTAVSIGFIGVLVVIRPGLGVFEPISLLPLAAAAMFAIYLVLTRMAARYDGVATSAFWTGAVGLIPLSFVGPFEWVAPTPELWIWLLVASAFGIAAHTCVIRALSLSEASALQPFNYTMLVWAAFLGLIVFGEFPDVPTLIGAGIVVASGLYAWHRERVRAGDTG